jgi:arsenate reductase
MSEAEILVALVFFPKLIERPIVIDENSGVLARPIENLIDFLKGN